MRELLARGDIEVAVIIDRDEASGADNVQLLSIGESEIKSAIELAVKYASSENSSSIKVNETSRGNKNIMNTLPFLLYKFIESGLVLGTMISSNESLNGTVYIVLIFALFSGMLFPFEYIPKAFKVIGSCAPQRWIVVGIKNIQKTGMFTSALPQTSLLILTSLLLLSIGV